MRDPSEEESTMGNEIERETHAWAMEIMSRCFKVCADKKYLLEAYVASLTSHLLAFGLMLEHKRHGPQGVDSVAKVISDMASAYLENGPTRANLSVRLLRKDGP